MSANYDDDAGRPARQDDVRVGTDPTGTSEEPEVLELRGNIEQTRAQMSETIDELQTRLSPAYIKEQVREQVREHYHQAKDSLRQATIGKVENMVERVSDTVYETRRGIVETVTGEGKRLAMVQEYLPAVEQGDKRILIIGKEVSAFELANGFLPWAKQIVLASPPQASCSCSPGG